MNDTRDANSYRVVREWVASELERTSSGGPSTDDWFQGRTSTLQTLSDLMDKLDEIT